MLNDVFPLRVEAVPAAHTSEWRADDSFPPRQTQAWQLIYVCSGTIEERCDDRRVLLRAGGLLFHQPGEVFAMIADETWRRYVPECWLTSASSTEKVSSVTARRDVTLYIKWTEAKAEGVASSKG